ncbi:MAG: hypothetical protein IT168_16080 [Bryobacterales bacterium]|nr:hypothetical protein [Bryobacterales bacterium]
MRQDNLVRLVVIAFVFGALHSNACEISGEDLIGLLNLHKAMLEGISRAIPAHEQILKEAPTVLTGSTVDCLVIGPLRFIHPPESKSVFVLDVKRVFDRWDVRNTGRRLPWQSAVRGYIHDYLSVSEQTLAEVYGRPGFSKEERTVLEGTEHRNLPPVVQTRIPEWRELADVEMTMVSSPVRGLISTLILRATADYVAQVRPGAWVISLNIGLLTPGSSNVSVNVAIDTENRKVESLVLSVAVNTKMAPYVGKVYPVVP